MTQFEVHAAGAGRFLDCPGQKRVTGLGESARHAP
jgi:hypothetical protein